MDINLRILEYSQKFKIHSSPIYLANYTNKELTVLLYTSNFAKLISFCRTHIQDASFQFISRITREYFKSSSCFTLQIFAKLISLFKNNIIILPRSRKSQFNLNYENDISTSLKHPLRLIFRKIISLTKQKTKKKEYIIKKKIYSTRNQSITNITNASKPLRFNLVHSIIIFYLFSLQIASCTTIQGTRFSSRDETLPPWIPPKVSQSYKVWMDRRGRGYTRH